MVHTKNQSWHTGLGTTKNNIHGLVQALPCYIQDPRLPEHHNLTPTDIANAHSFNIA